MRKRYATPYRPMYFLSSLGMGGLAVSFFVYLMFLVPHPTSPIPTFSDISAILATGPLVAQVLVALDLVIIAVLAVRHIQLLVRAIVAHRAFIGTDEYREFRNSNAEVSMMAIPLTLAMTVNVMFILGAVYVPGLWSVKEVLFPIALLAFAAIGAYAFVLFGAYLTRILTHQNFDAEDDNHFAQILPSFAFAMIATGFSSSAAMSSTTLSVVLGLLGSFVFLVATVAWISVKLPVGFAAMLRQGTAVVAAPTLWLGVPIFTLVGITLIRDVSGITHTLLHVKLTPMIWFVIFGFLLAGQILMIGAGWFVMRKLNYFATYVSGPEKSAASYGLICPGVALAVLSMFFIGWGLVETGLVEKFSIVHLALLAVVLGIQLVTARTAFVLNRKHFVAVDV